MATSYAHACAPRAYMNTSSLKSSNGISETRESCQQLSHQRRGPACSPAIIVPPWTVNPAERPSEIITAPRDVATGRGATRDVAFTRNYLEKKRCSPSTTERIPTNSSIFFLSPLEKKRNGKKKGRKKGRRRRRIKILDPVQAKRLKGQPLLFALPVGFRGTTAVIKGIERNNGDYVVTIDRAEARDQAARWKSMSHAA